MMLGKTRQPFLPRKLHMTIPSASAYLPSQNMCDPHEVIIDYICKVVRWPAIRFKDDEIVFSPETRYLTITKDQIRWVIFSRTRLKISYVCEWE